MRLFSFLFVINIILFLSIETSHAKGKIFNPKSKASVYGQIDSLNLAAIKARRSNLKGSFALLRDAAILAEKFDYSHGLVTSYLNKAEIYEQYDYIDKSMQLYFESLSISTAAQDTFNIARAKDLIGYSFINSKNHAKGIVFLKEAIKGYEALGKQEKAINLTNKIGLTKLSQNELKAAEKYFYRAHKKSEKIDYWYGEKKAYFNLGLLFLKKEDLKKSKTYFQQALKIDTEKGDKYGLSLATNKLSIIAIKEGDFNTAIQLAASALQYARELSESKLENDALRNLIEANEASGNMHKVINWQKELINIQQQEYKIGEDQTFIFLKLMEEEEKERILNKKLTLEAKQQATIKNIILVITIISTCVLSFIAFLWYKNYTMVRQYNVALNTRNREIEKLARKQDNLNQTILMQNKSLEENNQMKDKLFSIVSHDLRSPLASLKGLVNLMEHKNMPPEQVNHILSLLSRELDLVMDMLTNLLNWSRVQLSNTKLNIVDVQLHPLVQENLALLASQAGNKNISLQNNVPDDAVALGDKERLNFVIRNLVANAIKFTFEGGSIVVHAMENDDQIILAFSDNGKGISPENMARLFKGGRGFSTAGTAQEKGTGLGLNLSYDFITSINGRLEAESIENQGSTFRVTLPKATTTIFSETQEGLAKDVLTLT